MGIPDEPFWAPAELVDAYRAHAAASGGAARADWASRNDATDRLARVAGRVGRHRHARLDRGPPRRGGRREDRHPQGDRDGDQRHAPLPARPRRRRRRPHRQHRHQAQGRGRPVGRDPRRAPAVLRHPRARAWGRRWSAWRSTAASSRWAARSSCSSTTCARRCGWPSLSHAKVVLRLHPRLGRCRRGRSDPPAGRAARDAAGDPRPPRHPPRRRERDRRRRGATSSSTTAPRRSCSAARTSRSSPTAPPSRPVPASCATPTARPTSSSSAPAARSPLCVAAASKLADDGYQGPRGEHAELGSLRGAERGHPATGVPPRRAGAVGRGGHHVRLAPATPTTRSASTASAPAHRAAS